MSCSTHALLPASRRLFALAISICAVAAQGAPLEAYGQLPSIDKISLSPDGTRIALVRGSDTDRFVMIRAIEDGKALGTLQIGNVKVRELAWADDRRLMILTSVTGVPFGMVGQDGEWPQLLVYDIARKKSLSIPDDLRLDGCSKTINSIAGRVQVRNIDGHTVLFFEGMCGMDGNQPALMRADLDAREARLVEFVGDVRLVYWSFDPAGTLVAKELYSGESQRWSVHARRDGKMRELIGGQTSIEYPQVLGLGPVPETMLVDSDDDGEPQAAWRPLSLADGKLGSPAADGRPFDVAIEDRLTGRLIGASESEDYRRHFFFDSKIQAHWNAIVAAFKGDHVQFISASDGFTKVVVLVEGQTHGYEYRLVDLQTHRADRIGDAYDGITELLEVRRIDYPAADGLVIPAYLTLPRKRPAQNLPLVVLVHGGPAARDIAEFDWWSQALADQGYAVLRPNYRGSTVTKRLWEAGFGQFGRKMQTDLSDGVRYLSKQGIADPNRVCVVGGSYGGYAALAGATLDPAVYRCAVSVAGISDLKAFLKWINEWREKKNNYAQRFWDRFMGITGPNDPVLQQISPIQHVDAVTAPILLIHGKDDTVVPYDQSDDMVDALRHAKKTVEFVKLKNEDHWLSHSETRLQMLQATVAFLRKNNPPE